MVVTIDSKFYSKLQLGISKYQEKTPADPLKYSTQVKTIRYYYIDHGIKVIFPLSIKWCR